MSKTSKKSFVFNYEWQEVLKDYPAEVRLEVYDAIIEYAISGTLFELKPLAKMAFSFIKLQIDYNQKKYEEIVVKRSEAGKKGMQKRYQKEECDITNDNKIIKCYQDVTNITDNVIVNDIVADNVIENDNILSSKTDNEKLKINFELIADKFNRKLCPPLPKVIKVTEQRKKAIKSRINEHGEASIDEVFHKISESDFLMGKAEKGWVCTFDWVFSPRNYLKVLEGNYANNRSNYSSKREVNNQVFQDFLAEREQRTNGVAYEVEKPF